jgi:hypothetical protein
MEQFYDDEINRIIRRLKFKAVKRRIITAIFFIVAITGFVLMTYYDLLLGAGVLLCCLWQQVYKIVTCNWLIR